MKSVSQEEARRRVAEQAEIVRAAAGVTEFSESSANITPCDGRLGESSDIDEIYYIQGIYQLLVPPAEHPEVLRRVRSAWEGHGYTVKGERTFPSGGGELRAAAGEEYSAAITSGQEEAMLLLLSSPCYRVPGA